MKTRPNKVIVIDYSKPSFLIKEPMFIFAWGWICGFTAFALVTLWVLKGVQ